MDMESGVTAAGPGSRPGGRPLVALLIAGEPAEAERYATRLRIDGYTIAAATSLEQGLELAAEARPDLIFVCLGSWAVPALAMLVLRSDRATSGVPVVLVSDSSRTQLSAEVGGLLATEEVVTRGSDAPLPIGDRREAVRAGKPGHRPSWNHWLPRAR